MVINKVKEIFKLQDIIKTVKKSNRKKLVLVNILYFYFLRDLLEGYLSSEDAGDEKSKFSNEVNNIDKSPKLAGKGFLINNINNFLLQEKNLFITLKADFFQ